MTIKQVAAGIIVHNNKILIAQRRHGKSCEYMWEFPGGKLEANETMPQCLQRELMEELNLSVKVGKFFMESCYEYDFGTIELYAYFATCENKEFDIHPDHEQVRWIELKDIDNYNFAPADVPIVKELKTRGMVMEDAI